MHDAADAFQQIAQTLRGAPISHIWRGHGSALFVECGPLSESQILRQGGSPRNPKGQWTIGLEFDWRVEDDSRVVCGSSDEEAACAETIQSLLGDKIESVETFGDVAELRVTLQSGRRFLTFALASSGPEWTLTDNGADPAVWVYWSDGSLRTDDGQQLR